MTKGPALDETQKVKAAHEVRRVLFLRKFSKIVRLIKRTADEIALGTLGEETRNAVFFETVRMVGSLETRGWYREAELMGEVKNMLQPGRTITRHDKSRIKLLVAELERVANC